MKLRTFLMLTFTTFVLLLTAILGTMLGRQSSSAIRNEIGQSLSGIAYQMSDKLDNFMWSRAGEIEMLAALDTLQQTGSSKQIQQLLDRLKLSFSSYSWVGLVDPQGKVLAATDGILVGADVSSRPVYKEGIKGRFIGDVHDAVLLASLLPNPTGEPLQFVDISLPVKRADGTTVGVLAAHLSWEWAKEVQRTILEPQRDQSDALDLFIVSKTDSTVLLGPKDMVGKPLALGSVERAQSGENGWELAKWPDGKMYLTGFAYGDGYLSYEGLGWTVLVRQPEAVAYAPVAALRTTFIVAGAVAAVLFAIIGWFLAEKMSRPIRGLTDAADRLRAGEDVAIPEYRGFWELHSLSRSLRSLVESLVRTESALGDMKSRAQSDPLTGLPNRAALEGYLERTLGNVQPEAESLAFLYLDLDGFKKVNDTLGHQVGDILLQKVAQRLTSVTKPGDIAVRLGGDEFLLILRRQASLINDAAGMQANELIDMLNKPFVIDLNTVSVGCSVGVAFYPKHGTSPGEIIELADQCLYRSKQSGKNRVTFADDLRLNQAQ